jgi:hypothetical protein
MSIFQTETLAAEVRKWLYASAVGVIAILVLVALMISVNALFFYVISAYPFVGWTEIFKAANYLLVTPAKAILAIIIVTGGILFIDFCTPGEFLEQASEGNLACAILSGCIVIGLCLLLGWS